MNPPDEGLSQPPPLNPGTGASPLNYYSTTNKRHGAIGNGLLALLGAFVFYGAGHLLVGKYRRALYWFGIGLVVWLLILISVGVPHLQLALLVLFPAAFVVPLWHYVDAFRSGWSAPRKLFGGTLSRIGLGMGLFVAALVFGNVWVYGLRRYCVEAFFM